MAGSLFLAPWAMGAVGSGLKPQQTQGGVPKATTSSFGVVKPDGSTITVSGGVISAAHDSSTVTSVSVSAPLTSTGGKTPALGLGSLSWKNISSAARAGGLVGN